ncbi:dnaJ homolog subfamily C member 17-like isoform X2 [Xenia sp. Carnegie-2017]|uniref:dnaJ homolog subfamily C member 17-like isoform X2 n=1 Tax=Xenia sp. Carnegie-2017 TaxID=2897299 RepID=UPI001F047936|nr:dnaJ homolog subfamily C member 17-like isoform X2 [Xenia sp. Carnegie-2017]
MDKTKMADEMTYYELLEIERNATEKQITKAYRKKALKCHPDKNPDNPNAAELFHKLSKAFEVIGNPKAKAAYDATLKAKERARLRVQAYDSKRKKFKEDLEEREKSSQEEFNKDEVIVRNFEREIEHLREEGLKILQREQELMKQVIEKERQKQESSTRQDNDFTPTPKLKLRWKCSKSDTTNGGYSSEILRSMFRKYGDIENLLVSSKKMGSAIIEFRDFNSAKMAVENEYGNPANPLKITWLEGIGNPNVPTTTVETQFKSSPKNLALERDFETLVMRKLRQAEERKRLCEEIANEESR